MEAVKKQDVHTRQRLLESACQIFANKGYRDTTIADISELAGTNVAAVNYHFGDKEALYIESWRLAFHKSLETYPPDVGVSPHAPAEERFRGRIFAAMQRFAYSKNYEFEIMSKELATPTGLLAEVIRESIEPLRREFDLVIRELLGSHASEKQIQLCRMSVMAQCTNIMMHQQHRKLFAQASIKTNLSFEIPNVEMMADHVARFSLAGLREIRRQIEAGELIDQIAADSPKNTETRY